MQGISEPERRKILQEIRSVRAEDLDHVVAAAAQVVGETELVKEAWPDV